MTESPSVYSEPTHPTDVAAESTWVKRSCPLRMAHINEHMAFKYRLQVEQMIGQSLPPNG
jgi:hypothetical protein